MNAHKVIKSVETEKLVERARFLHNETAAQQSELAQIRRELKRRSRPERRRHVPEHSL